MSLAAAFFYDRFMESVEKACLREWRRELLAQAAGKVLEIGAGTGANIEFYPETISQLVMAEPDRHMRRLLQKKISICKIKDVHIVDETAESVKADSESFDCVVTTLVCCSFADIETALLQIRRVLKPGGTLLFMEHVAAHDDSRSRYWQNMINPLWRKMMGNCHLNRETESKLITSGFKIDQIKREDMATVIAPLLPTIRGCARKV